MVAAASRFNEHGPLYAFTTENLSGYLPLLARRGAAVLSVAGSGDHLLNAVLCGAAQVSAFDLNRRALWWCELKIAAANQLSFGEYLEFFLRQAPDGRPNPRALAPSRFEMLARDLSGPAREFFNACYKAHPDLRDSGIFNNRHDANELKIRCNPYLQSEQSFLALKEELRHARIALYSGSACHAARALAGSAFDLVLLSNIADYTDEFYPDAPAPLQSFTENVLRPFAQLLRPRGILCAAYLYDIGAAAHGSLHSRIDDPGLRRAVFREAGFHHTELSFPGVTAGRCDAVVLLTNGGSTSC